MVDIGDNRLQQLHPLIRKFVKALETNSKEISAKNFQLQKLFYETKEDNFANRFTLTVPYGGHYLEWEVIFSNDDLTFAPDFDFMKDDFLEKLDVEFMPEILPKWALWDYNNPNALYDVLNDFVKFYKVYQIELLRCDRYSNLFQEYISLINQDVIKEEDIETLLDEPSETVHFLITLSLDVSLLFPIIGKSSQEKEPALLMVKFQQKSDGRQFQESRLYLNPHIEEVLGGNFNIRIPSLPAQAQLLHYIPKVKQVLENKIKFVAESFQLKQKYIAHLLALYSSNILEYDSTTYSKATLLFCTDNLYWLLVITISADFPEVQPKWIIRSVYYTMHEQVLNKVLSDYPYSPRWTPDEMIIRCFKYTMDKVRMFQSKK